MSIATSTGYKALIMGPNAWEHLFDGGQIRVYAGTRPESADAPHGGTLLGMVERVGFGGLTFFRDGQYVTKPMAHQWQMQMVQTGVAVWCRLTGPGDDGSAPSVTLPRIDGDVGLASDPESFALFVFDRPNLSFTVSELIEVGAFFFSPT